MHSVRKTLLFTICSSSPEIVEISSRALTAKLTPVPFFVMKREFVNKSWTFYPPIPAVLRIYRSIPGKPHASSQKNMNCAPCTH
jgi:hypothetical protein